MPRITELSSMEAGQTQKRFLMNRYPESELKRLLEYIQPQRQLAEQRIDKLFCFLVLNACGGFSASWRSLDDVGSILETHKLIGIHVSSGFPILEKRYT